MNACPQRRGRSLRRRNATQRLLLPAALMMAVATPVYADAVTDWNAVASGPVVAPRFGGPQPQSRAMAIVQIAVHDALNAIDRRYETYNVVPTAAAGAAPDAAVAAAARTALLAMLGPLPSSQAKIDALAAIEAQYALTLGPGAPDAAEQQGIAAGETAAHAILAQRFSTINGVLTAIDGAATPNSPAYNLAPAPGVHQPTPAPEFPAETTPAFTGWPGVTPFALDSASQFRLPPGQIFDLGSERYASEYNQVMHLGDARVRGARPDSQQSDIPRFWAGGGLDWHANARIIASARHLDRWQHARMLALMTIATADALISSMESKYFYNFWRPVTAIRWADDGNPDTRSDPYWRPFLQTPPYPDYPCASTSATGAVAGTLRDFFGTNSIGFTRTVTAPPVPLPAPLVALPAKQITRHYGSLSIAENEQARGRMYAGIHFMEGCYAGLRQGNQVASFVFDHYLRPAQ